MFSDLWRAGYVLGLVISRGIITAYILTWSTGLSHATGHIGNWVEPSGVASLLMEAAFVVNAVIQLRCVPAGFSNAAGGPDL